VAHGRLIVVHSAPTDCFEKFFDPDEPQDSAKRCHGGGSHEGLKIAGRSGPATLCSPFLILPRPAILGAMMSSAWLWEG